MWANTVAHNGFLGVGRAEDWGSHMIAFELR
jgi:alcohol dehydrogenase